MTQPRAVVVIPVWRPYFTGDEALSLSQVVAVLGHHPIALVAPDGLPIEGLPLAGVSGRVERFAPRYFAGAAGYNRLMLGTEIYERFGDYEYILVYQLDAFVFEDRLAGWCARGYDYVGAPWVGDSWPDLPPLKRWILRTVTTPRTRVGNGGFSLRRVSSFLHALRRLAPIAARWRSNEDLFWSVVARHLAGFRIPPADEALSFSFELEPRRCYQLLGQSLPFGCHAWPRHDPRFWRGVFAALSPAGKKPG